MDPLKIYEKTVQTIEDKINNNKHFLFRKNLWGIFISFDFLLNLAFLIIIRIFIVGISYLPPYVIDSYLRNLSDISRTNSEGGLVKHTMFVYYQTFFIIFLLYFQSNILMELFKNF